jgi:hypothetical protein
MTSQEIQRAIQYVVASTSYGKDTVSQIVHTGFSELEALATTTSHSFSRDQVLEYVSRWTMTKTGQPEPLVREILGCAGRWLDELYAQLAQEHPDQVQQPDGDVDEGRS